MTIYRCSNPDCPHSAFMASHEGLSKNFVYTCSVCAPETVMADVPHFQSYAFDPKLGTNKRKKGGVGELSNLIDGPLTMFSIKTIRQKQPYALGYGRVIPEWAKTNAGIKNILMIAFPKLQVNPHQRKHAGRWAQVIQLYFQQGLSFSDVAEELAEKPRSIETVIRSIVRTSKGLRADGKGPRKTVHAVI